MNVSTTADAATTTDADTLVAMLGQSGTGRTERGQLTVTREEARNMVTVGAGDLATCDRQALHGIVAAVVARLDELGAEHVCWTVPQGIDPTLATSAIVEGTLLATYRCTAYKSADDEASSLSALTVAGTDAAAAAARAVVVTQAVNRARDLQNGPPNVITPTYLGQRAQAIAAAHADLSCEVGGAERLAELGMGAFAAVTQGSDSPPALIVLRYEPAAAAGGPLLALVGKGVTFDSGGLSIKPASGMVTMKADMSGAAAVLEATAAIAELGLPIRLLTVIGSAENMISGGALKVGDVVTAASGTTIEIDNTDAEGRLVLADCLHHAVELGADRIIDLATLTGAMKVALGSEYCGYFATDDAVSDGIEQAAAAAGESVWRMPLDRRYADYMKGTIADLTNAAIGKGGGACSAAGFLQRFTGEKPWAHFDLSTAYDAGLPWAKKGGSGTMVRTLVALAEQAA